MRDVSWPFNLTGLTFNTCVKNTVTLFNQLSYVFSLQHLIELYTLSVEHISYLVKFNFI